MWGGPGAGAWCEFTVLPQFSSTSVTEVWPQATALPRRITTDPLDETESGHGVELISFSVVWPTDLRPGQTLYVKHWWGSTTGSLPLKEFYGARQCASGSFNCNTNVDFGPTGPHTFDVHTLQNSGYAADYSMILPSGSGGSNWIMWPAYCHMHSSCVWGPSEWHYIALPVSS